MPAIPLLLDTRLLLEQIRAFGAIGADAASGGRTRIALTDAENPAGTSPCNGCRNPAWTYGSTVSATSSAPRSGG